MDPPTNLDELVDDLDVNIDELSTALHPLFNTPLRTQTSALPLLDKAKLHILAALAIESLLYSALLTAGVDAKSHPIFAELARLKAYNAKIKAAEDAGNMKGPAMRLDKGAAARFIRHGLAGNERVDLERAEREAKERAIAAVRAARESVNVKFDPQVEDERAREIARKRKAEEMERGGGVEEEESDDEESEDEGELEDEEGAGEDAGADKVDEEEDESPNETTTPSTSTKKPRLSTASSFIDDTPAQPTSTPSSSRKSKRRKSKTQPTPTSNSTPTTPTTPSARSRKRRKSKNKKAKQSLRPEKEFIHTEQGAPKTRSETFQALMDGSHAGQMRERAEEKARRTEEKAARRAARSERVRF